jgi:hypothetical protein
MTRRGINKQPVPLLDSTQKDDYVLFTSTSHCEMPMDLNSVRVVYMVNRLF